MYRILIVSEDFVLRKAVAFSLNDLLTVCRGRFGTFFRREAECCARGRVTAAGFFIAGNFTDPGII